MFDPGLKPGQTIGNRQLMDIFHCACEGGIRYASRTGTVVIVVNRTKEGLPNIWRDEVLYFAGRPLKEDKGMTGANKRLAEFLKAGGPVFLFVVEKQGEYIYQGAVKLAGAIEQGHTASGAAYPVFPLRVHKS